MSIKDAEHIPSWQIGFEDGIKFVLNNFEMGFKKDCPHLWRPLINKPGLIYCVYCSQEKVPELCQGS